MPGTVAGQQRGGGRRTPCARSAGGPPGRTGDTAGASGHSAGVASSHLVVEGQLLGRASFGTPVAEGLGRRQAVGAGEQWCQTMSGRGVRNRSNCRSPRCATVPTPSSWATGTRVGGSKRPSCRGRSEALSRSAEAGCRRGSARGPTYGRSISPGVIGIDGVAPPVGGEVGAGQLVDPGVALGRRSGLHRRGCLRASSSGSSSSRCRLRSTISPPNRAHWFDADQHQQHARPPAGAARWAPGDSRRPRRPQASPPGRARPAARPGAWSGRRGPASVRVQALNTAPAGVEASHGWAPTAMTSPTAVQHGEVAAVTEPGEEARDRAPGRAR